MNNSSPTPGRPAGKVARRPFVAAATLGILVIAGIGLAGSKFGLVSFAAQSVNPYGSFDYCTIENNATVILGWAADPNATTLPQPNVSIRINDTAHLQPTSLTPYRETQINNHITSTYPRDPKPGSYGFKLTVNGLYKGSRNTISGTILNVGAGSNVPLSVNKSGKVDNIPANTFVGGIIPEACLATKPAPPPPPAPTPAPVRPAPVPTAASPLSGAADATVVTGTFSAELQIPAGNAETIRIKYGTDPAALNKETAAQNVTSDPTALLVSGLEAATTYSYQIIRSRSGVTAVSPIATLTTAGIVAQLSVLTAEGKPVEGIKGTISPTGATATTNQLGVMQFPNLVAGTYKVSFDYQGKTREQQIILDGKPIPATESGNQPVTREFTVNLASSVTIPEEKKQSQSFLVPAALLLLLIGGLAAALFRKRQRTPSAHPAPAHSVAATPPRPASPSNPPVAAPPFAPMPPDPQPSTPSATKPVPVEPAPHPLDGGMTLQSHAAEGSSFSPVQAPAPVITPTTAAPPPAPLLQPEQPMIPPPPPAPAPIPQAPPVPVMQPAAPPAPPALPQPQYQSPEPLILSERPDIPQTGRSLKEMVLEAMAEEQRRKNGPPGPQ